MSRKVALLDVNGHHMQVVVKVPKLVVDTMPSSEYFDILGEFIKLSEKLLESSKKWQAEYDQNVWESNYTGQGEDDEQLETTAETTTETTAETSSESTDEVIAEKVKRGRKS
jgi:hypothetical protein